MIIALQKRTSLASCAPQHKESQVNDGAKKKAKKEGRNPGIEPGTSRIFYLLRVIPKRESYR